MTNPWLTISAEDYEAHMASPEVGQLQLLNQLFKAVLEEHRPVSLAILGCSTGNGFEHIDPTTTRRVVGIDVNPSYLGVARKRFLSSLPMLELLEADFTSASFAIDPVSLVFAALIFEYVSVGEAVRNISASLTPGGVLVAALQLPSLTSTPVTKTRFKSLEALGPIMNLVSPEEFSLACFDNGLREVRQTRIPLKQGKELWVGFYRKDRFR
jgi:SAM-dependent methyltransferase